MAQTQVTTNVIADDAITAAKIDDNAVGAAAIVDDSITNAKIKSDAAIAMTKLAVDPTDASNISSGTLPAGRYTDTVYTHPTTAGNKHIPTAGATDQVLTYSSSGTAAWADVSAGLTLDSTVKTASFTAEAGKQYLINTNGGAFTMTLPAGSAGDTIGIIDYQGDFDTNNLTLGQSGSEKIFRADANGTIDTKNWSTSIKYIDATVGWLPVGD